MQLLFALLGMGDTNNTHNEHANIQMGEPNQAGAVAAGRQRADEFLRGLLDGPQAYRPTRLEVLHRRKRLESERKKALIQRRARRAQLIKLKRSLDETEANISRIEAEIRDVERDWVSASDDQPV